MIPKIIHQTWKTENIPEEWRDSVKSCKKVLKGFKYILWTHKTMDEFVKNEYPDFYKTYISYQYDIQRCDAFRYLVLYKYGGIYYDLDIICKQKFDNLMKYDLVFVKSMSLNMGHLANYFYMSKPKHPFFKYSIEQLEKTKDKYKNLGKHFHVMYSTGPTFLTENVKKYKLKNIENCYVLTKKESIGDCDGCNFGDCKGGTYFKILKGQTWNSWDSQCINFLRCKWKIYIPILIVIIAIIIGIVLYFKYNVKYGIKPRK